MAVRSHLTVAVDHHHHLVFGGKGSDHHFDPRIDCAGGLVDLLEQPDFLPDRDLRRTGLDRVKLVPRDARANLHRAGVVAVLIGDHAGGLRRQAHPVNRHLIGIGITGAILRADPDPDPLRDALGGLADDRLLQRQGLGAAELEIEIGIIGLALQRRSQRPFKGALIETEAVEKKSIRLDQFICHLVLAPCLEPYYQTAAGGCIPPVHRMETVRRSTKVPVRPATASKRRARLCLKATS